MSVSGEKNAHSTPAHPPSSVKHLKREEVGECVGEGAGGEGLAADEAEVLPRLVGVPAPMQHTPIGEQYMERNRREREKRESEARKEYAWYTYSKEKRREEDRKALRMRHSV